MGCRAETGCSVVRPARPRTVHQADISMSVQSPQALQLSDTRDGHTGSAEPALAAERRHRLQRVGAAIDRFAAWLDRFGETSLDFQTVYAGGYGRLAKSLYYRHKTIGTLAVAPLVLCEAFVPAGRALWWGRQRFPIGDAHYAMAFARRYLASN